MSVDVRELHRLKNVAKEAESKRLRAEAVAEEAAKRLHDLGYDSVEQAEKALAKLKKQAATLEAEIQTGLEKLAVDFPDL